MGSRSKGIRGADQDVVRAPGRRIGHMRRPRLGRYVLDPASLPKQATVEQIAAKRKRARRLDGLVKRYGHTKVCIASAIRKAFEAFQ